MTAFEKLGKDVATALKHGPGDRRARQLSALLAVDWKKQRGARRTWWLVPALAPVVAAFVFWSQPWKATAPHDAAREIAGDQALSEGRWLKVAEGSGLKLRFGDGTELDLDSKSTGRIGKRSGNDARLTVESGRLRARVTPAAVTGRTWTFEAGPYEVTVVGTELVVAWSSESGHLSVDVSHGRVQVRGGQVGGNGILLGAGDHLDAEPGRLEVRRAEAPPVVDRSKAPAADTGTPSEPIEKPAASATSAPRAAVSNEPAGDSWKTLARAGNYEEALAAADREGFDDLIARLPAVDVALLADAARLAGDRARARRALLTLRHRFPGIDAAHLAAFRLGRLALAEQAYGDAAGWFRTYLTEVPSGTLADEATGRLIEAQARAGDRNGARATAEKYLERFSGGPYESLARGMLRGDKLVPRNEGRTVHE